MLTECGKSLRSIVERQRYPQMDYVDREQQQGMQTPQSHHQSAHCRANRKTKRIVNGK